MRTLMYALRAYHEEHGHFPPPYVADDDGNPMHSWRVLILPYIEEEALYDRYKIDEPWDGPNNRLLLDERPDIFCCPSYGGDNDYPGDHLTNYVLVTGKGTVFSPDGKATLASVADGSPGFIIATEVNKRSVPWTAPVDLPIEGFVAMFGKTEVEKENGSNHDGEFVVVGFVDGSVRAVPLAIEQETIRAMVTVAGSDMLDHLGSMP